jgi:hypothetical protein
MPDKPPGNPFNNQVLLYHYYIVCVKVFSIGRENNVSLVAKSKNKPRNKRMLDTQNTTRIQKSESRSQNNSKFKEKQFSFIVSCVSPDC